jgi:DNA repair protein RecN (Recombination protein N)
MLQEITIKDFAIIDELSLDFSDGFNVLTGETGAGKSIILDAVSLLLGARAETAYIRANANIALVEGAFRYDDPRVKGRIEAILTREELTGETDGIVVISREIKRNGRSTARVNGHITTVATVEEIGTVLIDIHGQGDYLTLLRPDTHLVMIDRYAGLEDERRAFSKLVNEIETTRSELKRLITNARQIEARIEMLEYKVEEIRAANLNPGELDELEEEGRRLANAEQIADLSQAAYLAVYNPMSEEGFSTADLLTQAANALARLQRIDPNSADMAELAEGLSVQAEELARSLADYQENIEFDPTRLQQVELRIDLINMLMRKNNCQTIEELLEAADEAEKELESIGNNDARIEQLRAKETRLLSEIGAAGSALSAKRGEAASRLADLVEKELNHLKMDRARFSVAIEQADDPNGAPVGDYRVAFDETGIDRIEFLLAPNPGEPFKPMSKIASGGETSRIMLALKTVLSRADDTPTLIFDEIDTGIGGRIGAIVGQKLWSLSTNHQVLVVTHLPQLAGFADAHFKVEKKLVGDRTITHVHMLEKDHRVSELSEMLGAEADSARRNAEEILDYVTRIKEGVLSSAG